MYEAIMRFQEVRGAGYGELFDLQKNRECLRRFLPRAALQFPYDRRSAIEVVKQ